MDTNTGQLIVVLLFCVLLCFISPLLGVGIGIFVLFSYFVAQVLTAIAGWIRDRPPE